MPLKHSFSWWCFADLVDPQTLISAAARIGYDGVDLVDQGPLGCDSRSGVGVGCGRRAYHTGGRPQSARQSRSYRTGDPGKT